MVISYTDREALRNELRKIDYNSHKGSEGIKSLYEGSSEKFGTLSEDKLIDIIQYLRSDSGRYGKSRMDVMLEHQKGTYDLKGQWLGNRKNLHEAFMREKMSEEKGYSTKGDTTTNNFTNSVVQEEKTNRSIDEIKAEFINEMNKLTKKYQDEINNLR